MERTVEHHVRAAQPADAEAIAAIYNATVDAGDASMDEAHRAAADVRRRLAELGRREAVLVLEEWAPGAAARVVGWGTLERYSPRAGYRFAAETAVYLRRNRVRRGLGTRVKRALIERARELGVHHLVAKVLSANRASVEYNLRLGYEIVGVQREIGWRNGQRLDVTILQLVLDPDRAGELDRPGDHRKELER